MVVAGVIDPLTNFVEHPEVVADRLESVAQVVGDPTRVLAGTDCGFDTSAGRGRVAEDVVWAKLAAMAEGARIASRRLGMASAYISPVMPERRTAIIGASGTMWITVGKIHRQVRPLLDTGRRIADHVVEAVGCELVEHAANAFGRECVLIPSL